MKISNLLIRLSYLVVLLSAIATIVGLFWQGGNGLFIFTSVHGKTVELFSKGLSKTILF